MNTRRSQVVGILFSVVVVDSDSDPDADTVSKRVIRHSHFFVLSSGVALSALPWGRETHNPGFSRTFGPGSPWAKSCRPSGTFLLSRPLAGFVPDPARDTGDWMLPPRGGIYCDAEQDAPATIGCQVLQPEIEPVNCSGFPLLLGLKNGKCIGHFYIEQH